MKKISVIPFLVLLFIILNLFLISAQEISFTGKANAPLNITDDCNVNGFPCDSGFTCFVTVELSTPKQQVIVLNQTMTKNQTVHNYTLSAPKTTTLGIYKDTIYCSNGTLAGKNIIYHEITTFGNTLDLPRAILYFILLAGSMFLFLLCLWGAVVLPFSNNRTDIGQIYSIGKLKYFKLLFMFLCFPLLIWIVNLLFSLSNNFQLLAQYNTFIQMIFIILMNLSWPVFFIMMGTFVFVAWKDLELIKLLTRGLNPT